MNSQDTMSEYPTPELIQPNTLQSWVKASVVEHIVETEFYNIGEGKDLFLYWRNFARQYDGFLWEDIRVERLFWLEVIYTLCDKHYETGLHRDVRQVIMVRGFNYKD